MGLTTVSLNQLIYSTCCFFLILDLSFRFDEVTLLLYLWFTFILQISLIQFQQPCIDINFLNLLHLNFSCIISVGIMKLRCNIVTIDKINKQTLPLTLNCTKKNMLLNLFLLGKISVEQTFLRPEKNSSPKSGNKFSPQKILPFFKFKFNS